MRSTGGRSAGELRYGQRFYERRGAGQRQSAEVVVDTLQRLGIPTTGRILDVGCGRGDWLHAFAAAGAASLTGIDGEWNERHFEGSDGIDFRAADLDRATLPELTELVGPGADLAVCVEVVEHLAPGAGDVVIELLARSAPIVVFSAAIPGQGGTGHRNEQWPSHWARRFSEHGLEPFDLLRPIIWDDSRVEYWYRQNVLLFARAEALAPAEPTPVATLDLVHPEMFVERCQHPEPRLWVRAAPRVAVSAMRSVRLSIEGVRDRLRWERSSR